MEAARGTKRAALVHEQAPVDIEGVASDVGRGRRTEEEDRSGYLLGFTEARQGSQFGHPS